MRPIQVYRIVRSYGWTGNLYYTIRRAGWVGCGEGWTETYEAARRALMNWAH